MICYISRIVALIILIAVISGYSNSNDIKTDSYAETAIPVTTVKVIKRLVNHTLNYSGSVEAWSRVALGSEIPGRIVALNCDVGDLVHKDSLLVKLGSETLIQTRANYNAVKKDWERIKTLRESGTVSQQAYDQMQAAYKAAKAVYEKTLISTQIRAPFNGVITQKFLDVGEVYSLFPGQAGSPAIVELMQIDTVKVAVAVTESQYRHLALSQKATLKLDAYPDRPFVGTVSRIDPTVSTKTRTANVEIQFANSSGIIKPGMFGFVKISLPSRHALLVNRDVLIKQEGTGIFYVFTVQNDTVSRVNVIIGDHFGGLVEVKSGLKPGDTVVTTGKMEVKTGSRIQIASTEVTK